MSLGLESVKLAYDVAVPAQEKDVTSWPIILLHGMMSSRTTWLDMPQNIADATKREVYSLDARNHGESEWSDEFHYDLMARDVENFMDEVNISKAVLIGHGMGGKTAMILALSKPEKVEKLVIEDISPKRPPPALRFSSSQYVKLRRESLSHVADVTDLETAREMLVKYIRSHTPEEHLSTKAAERRVTTLPIRMTENGIAWQANIDAIERNFFINPKRQKELEGVYDKEALFIYGTKSIYGVQKEVDSIRKIFPMAVLSGVEDATHFVHLEFPEEFCARVVEFIGKKED